MATDSTSSVPGLARVSDSDCYAEYSASLKCIWTEELREWYLCTISNESVDSLDDFSYDKSKCQQQFDAYKECRKKERERRLERNRKRSFFQ